MNWVVDVDHELVANMANKTLKETERWKKETERWKNQSIYKVPQCVSVLNSKAYKPQVVSFGPYHHDDAHLKPMESHKERALFQFLKRSKQSLEKIYKSLSVPEVVQCLKDNYDSLGEYDNDKFLKMMILDGCFLIEILIAWDSNPSNDYSENDPIFSAHGMLYIVPFIKRDMLMLENQLPMMLFDNLIPSGFENAKGDNQLYMNKLILEFCDIQFSTKVGKCLHVLDVVRKSMIVEDPPPTVVEPTGKNGTDNGDQIVLSAIELDEAGVQFKISNSQSLRDISFKGGELSLPKIVIDDTTESTFLNLIAFERCHVGAGNAITSYVCFMDSLVDDGRDINLLHSKKIVWNVMGSNKVAANLFNNMSKDLTIDPNSELSKVNLEINKYCKKTWNKYRANLVHTYFRNPWAIVSVFAAIFLFALTIVQTVYSVLGTY